MQLVTQPELARDILLSMFERSGVVAWESDSETRSAMVDAANEMAAALLLPGQTVMAKELYLVRGTTIVFGSEGGDDVAWSTENIGNGAGRQSAFWDAATALGATRPIHFEYRFYTQAQATPTVGNACRIYLKTSDGTHPDNDDGVGDAAVSAEDKLKNLTPLQPAIVDEAAANIEYVSQGIIPATADDIAVVLWNAMGSSITNDATETKLELTPVYWQQQ